MPRVPSDYADKRALRNGTSSTHLETGGIHLKSRCVYLTTKEEELETG